MLYKKKDFLSIAKGRRDIAPREAMGIQADEPRAGHCENEDRVGSFLCILLKGLSCQLDIILLYKVAKFFPCKWRCPLGKRYQEVKTNQTHAEGGQCKTKFMCKTLKKNAILKTQVMLGLSFAGV